jgi:hypothetical protein
VGTGQIPARRERVVIAVGVALAAVAFVVLILHFAAEAAREWFAVLAVAGALAALAMHLWHRRWIAEIEQRELALTGRWRPAHWSQRWPQLCKGCGLSVSSWRAKTLHDNPDRSPCAAKWLARDPEPAETLESGGAQDDDTALRTPTYTLTRVGGRGGGDGAVDTAELDQDAPAELDPADAEEREAAWARMGGLIARTTRSGSGRPGRGEE